MAGEEHRLLGVGAVAADDDQRVAILPGRGGQAIERGSHVGSHRLALPHRVGPGVLSRVLRAAHPGAGACDELGLRADAGAYCSGTKLGSAVRPSAL